MTLTYYLRDLFKLSGWDAKIALLCQHWRKGARISSLMVVLERPKLAPKSTNIALRVKTGAPKFKVA